MDVVCSAPLKHGTSGASCSEPFWGNGAILDLLWGKKIFPWHDMVLNRTVGIFFEHPKIFTLRCSGWRWRGIEKMRHRVLRELAPRLRLHQIHAHVFCANCDLRILIMLGCVNCSGQLLIFFGMNNGNRLNFGSAFCSCFSPICRNKFGEPFLTLSASAL